MKKHIIIGKPIKHSLSPKIHNYWFKKYNIDYLVVPADWQINLKQIALPFRAALTGTTV